MARVLVAAQTLPGAYPTLPVGAGTRTLTFQVADPSNLQYTPLVSGKTVIVCYNTDSSAHTVTFTSVADSLNRVGDITAYSIAAGVIAIFGPFQTAGWSNGGQVWFQANDATVKFAVITNP
jgi:hypothetical protein